MALYRIFGVVLVVWGATWEDHVAITEDGFHLHMFRITGFADTGPIEITKPPLVLTHPMF
jgi:hypothetical protein